MFHQQALYAVVTGLPGTNLLKPVTFQSCQRRDSCGPLASFRRQTTASSPPHPTSSSLSQVATGSAGATANISGSVGGSGGGWEAVERFGDGAVSTPLGEASVCEELSLDAAGCVVADSIVERPRGWTILRPLLASLDRAAWQRVGADRGGREWHRVVSYRLVPGHGIHYASIFLCHGWAGGWGGGGMSGPGW